MSILLVSENDEDLRFWGDVAARHRLALRRETKSEEVSGYLRDHPESMVFWDVGLRCDDDSIETVLRAQTRPDRVFAITNRPCWEDKGFATPLAFSHHITRRYDGHAPTIYSKLIEGLINPGKMVFTDFFSEDLIYESRMITKSSQKHETLEWVKNFVVSCGAPGRLAAISLETADELLMNAIFDAPVDSTGKRYRVNVSRAADFDLSAHEHVKIEIACDRDLIGISVTDQFGSLERDVVMDHLHKDHTRGPYHAPTATLGAGLGLYRINRQAMAIRVCVQAGVRTEVTTFMSNALRYKDVRGSFCFCSIVME